MKVYFLFWIALIVGTNSFGQKNNIDLFCRIIDSSLVDENIILHSVRHQTGFAEARSFDHYYIDTSKGILVKSIYEFSFEGGEYLEFYFQGTEIVKIKAKHLLDERNFQGSFYFKSDILIAHTDGEISPGKIVFDLEELLKTGNGHMNSSIGIIKSLTKETSIK